MNSCRGQCIGLILTLDHCGNGAAETSDSQLFERKGVRVMDRHSQNHGSSGTANNQAMPELVIGGVTFEHIELFAFQLFHHQVIVVDTDD